MYREEHFLDAPTASSLLFRFQNSLFSAVSLQPSATSWLQPLFRYGCTKASVLLHPQYLTAVRREEVQVWLCLSQGS